MGTRHLIAVVVNGKPVIAQYGQWDGYPTGQGVDVLAFVESLVNPSVPGMEDLFRAKLAQCRFGSEDELTAIYAPFSTNGWMNIEQSARFQASSYAYLSRDTGSDILDIVFQSTGPMVLKNSWDFGRDGLFCEWAYVIDMDTRTLEVYSGFHEGAAAENQRFAGEGSTEGYGGVHLLKSYPFDTLPDKTTFIAELAPSED